MALLFAANASGPASFARPEDALPSGASVLQRLTTDLDGDGVPEEVLVAGVRDASTGADVFNGGFTVHVLGRSGRAWRKLGEVELMGVPDRVVVVDLGSGPDRMRVLISAAGHCGGSCAGAELHAHTVRGGALIPLLDLDGETTLFKGWAVAFPGRFLETWTREDDDPGRFAECCPSGYHVTRLAPRGGQLVQVDSAHVLPEEVRLASGGAGGRSATGWSSVGAGSPGPILSNAQLAGRDWLIRPGRSIGKLSLGMTPEQVRSAVGPPSRVRGDPMTGAVEVRGDQHRLWVHYDGGRVVQVTVTSPRFRNGTGLGPGVTVSDVEREYPKTARPSQLDATVIETYTGLVFEVVPGPSPSETRVRAVMVHPMDRSFERVDQAP